MRRLIVRLLLIVVGLGLVVILVEVGARAYYRLAWGVPLRGEHHLLPPHPVFGWEGRQVFGSSESRRVKVFVVGDSFTAGLGVPERQLYASVLGAVLNVEIFIYGGPGYGTLQEYLVLDHYLPVIQPDLVLLQLCSNDVINNSWALERGSYFNNNRMVRPYLIGDRIEYRFPSAFIDLGPAIAQSRLVYLLAVDGSRVAAALAKRRWLHSVEDDIAAQFGSFVPFREAVEITTRLLVKMRERVGSVPLVVFPADGAEDAWRSVIEPLGLRFVGTIPGVVREAEARGASLRSEDGVHWNVAGHALVGRELSLALAPPLRR